MSNVTAMVTELSEFVVTVAVSVKHFVTIVIKFIKSFHYCTCVMCTGCGHCCFKACSWRVVIRVVIQSCIKELCDNCIAVCLLCLESLEHTNTHPHACTYRHNLRSAAAPLPVDCWLHMFVVMNAVVLLHAHAKYCAVIMY